MSQKQDTTFKTEYRCGNCGNRWEESHEPGTEVIDDWRGVYIRAPQDSATGRVECGVCALQKEVSVIERSPL